MFFNNNIKKNDLNNMKKYYVIIIVSFLFLVCLSLIYKNDTKELKLTKNMFGCDIPSTKGEVKLIIDKTTYMPYLEKKLFVGVNHPLGRYFTFYKIVTPSKKTLWLCPELRIMKTANGATRIRSVKQKLPWRWWVFGFSILLLLLPCAAYPYLSRKRPDILHKFDSIKDWCNISVILGVCCLSLIILLIYSDNIITSASDDPGYFKTAIDILNLDFKGPWSFTIGLGIWYMPFIIFLNAKTFYDIALPFATFCGFIVMPLTMIFIYFIIKKLAASRTKALVAVLFLALFPFFYHHIQDWNVHYFKSFFAFPPVHFNKCFYNIILIRGYNCMSDTSSNFLLMLSAMLILYLPARLRFVTLISFVYGFACLVRINNIFFAPLLAWLFWMRFSEKNIELKYLLKAAFIASLISLITFLPQFIINYVQFDSFSTFPYVMHNVEVSRGFKWSMLDTGITFMGGANFAIWAAGLSGMLFIRDRKLRNTLILWAVPVILFFFGYPFVFCDARRFILSSFGAMFAAFVCVEVWGDMSLKKRIASFVIIGTGLLFFTPARYVDTGQLPFSLQHYTWGVTLIMVVSILTPLATIALVWYLHQQERAMFFVICFGILYYAGSVYLLAAVMVLVLLWALYDWGVEIYKSKIFRQNVQ